MVHRKYLRHANFEIGTIVKEWFSHHFRPICLLFGPNLSDWEQWSRGLRCTLLDGRGRSLGIAYYRSSDLVGSQKYAKIWAYLSLHEIQLLRNNSLYMLRVAEGKDLLTYLLNDPLFQLLLRLRKSGPAQLILVNFLLSITLLLIKANFRGLFKNDVQISDQNWFKIFNYFIPASNSQSIGRYQSCSLWMLFPNDNTHEVNGLIHRIFACGLILPLSQLIFIDPIRVPA